MNMAKTMVLQSEYDKLVEENKRLLVALEIYANTDNWIWGVESGNSYPEFIYHAAQDDPTKPARDALREQLPWIPCSEEMPSIEPGEHVSRQVQAFNEIDILSPCVYVPEPFKAYTAGWYHHGKRVYERITHWRYMPEPPQEANEK